MRLFATLAATWPPAEILRLGGWTLRRGAGGGRRVSAATLDGPDGDIAGAEAAMRAWGQRPTFMIRPGDAALDAALAARGYAVRDASLILAVSAAPLAPAGPDERAVPCDAPLARMREFWQAGGIGPDRLAVMGRARGPKTFLLGRIGDRPAGCAFVACDWEVAMLHALEVAPPFRRQGLGTALTRAAAGWAVRQGVGQLALAVTLANEPARRIYDALGMTPVAAYHYRIAP